MRHPRKSPVGGTESKDSLAIDRLRRKGPDDSNRHLFTYIGIFLFSLIVYFRPYEMFPSLVGFSSMAFWTATLTLFVYLFTQLLSQMKLSKWTLEVKCLLIIAGSAIVFMPLAKDPALAWNAFAEYLSKILIIFIIMTNVLTTRRRIKGLMMLGIGIGVYLSYQAYDLYRQGIFEVEGYRVAVNFGGMFGNPNDMSIHLVIFIPIAISLGLASGSGFVRLAFLASALLMAFAITLTQSRGGFIGLVAGMMILIWKLYPAARLRAFATAAVLGIGMILIAPGNYGIRVLAIFDSRLDPTGSSSERQEQLERSILVTIRNPLGIGLGNSPLIGVRNLQTHNSYTQVGSELGWLALAAYITMLIAPLRRMSRIQRSNGAKVTSRRDLIWAAGIQSAIIGYMFSSFFGSIAFQWYVYFPIAYAIGMDHIISENKDKSVLRTAA